MIIHTLKGVFNIFFYNLSHSAPPLQRSSAETHVFSVAGWERLKNVGMKSQMNNQRKSSLGSNSNCLMRNLMSMMSIRPLIFQTVITFRSNRHYLEYFSSTTSSYIGLCNVHLSRVISSFNPIKWHIFLVLSEVLI